jgi:GNAT superfamily N-acetyltransferase
MSKIEIKEVVSKKDLNTFIKFPDQLYKGNPYRVPQLHTFEKSTLMKEKNPAFDYCEAKYWLAYKDGKVVGRIAGILNPKSNEIWKEQNMRFGWIDFIDDIEVSKALMDTVGEWAKEKGMNKVHGPLGFTDMDLEGMLVEGFDEIATQAVLYNYPYYPQHLEKLGFSKETDWLQLELKIPKEVPAKIKRISKIVQDKYNLKYVKFKSAKEVKPYAKQVFDVINASYTNLYGFVPLTEKQIEYYVNLYFDMVNPKYLGFVVDENDKLVGFGLGILSLSKAMIKAKGKLLPFGWFYLLKDLYYNDTIDLLLHAVLPEYHGKGVPAIFYEHMTQACIDNGVHTAITSHILEENKPSLQMFNPYDSRQHLRRRVYGIEL